MKLENELRLPFYVSATMLILGLYLFVLILIQLQGILLPLIYSTLLAIVIAPFPEKLARLGFSRFWSIITVLITSLILLAGIAFLISSQWHKLVETWPQLQAKINDLWAGLIAFLSSHIDYNTKQMEDIGSSLKTELLSNGSGKISVTISSLGGFITTVMLTPVYVFMLLFYKSHIINFIHKQSGSIYNKQVRAILTKTKKLIRQYLYGLCIQIAILAVLNTVGLFIIGIEYAVLLGVMGAFLNLIPYLGGIMAVLIYATIALLTQSPIHVLYVGILYGLIQFIDNNLLVPKIVGSKVSLNAFVSILAVICGASL
ncbi:MAG: AI-2E family transporter, partial [Salibacteraceae bacterium]